MLKVRQRNGSNDPKNCELVRNLPPLMYVQGAALSVRLGGIHELGGGALLLTNNGKNRSVFE